MTEQPERKRDVIDLDTREKCVDAQADKWGLYNATPGCPGRIVSGNGGGIRCNTCSGWFCF